jgi:hypothetical protein
MVGEGFLGSGSPGVNENARYAKVFNGFQLALYGFGDGRQ